jgi:hypothetical protein
MRKKRKRKANATTPPSKRLAAVLELDDTAEFFDKLSALDEKHSGMDFHHRPEPLGMLGGLYALHTDVVLDGIKKFLCQAEGAGFHQTVEWCKRIGARRAATYLEAVAALYPGGRVPEDDEARFNFVMDLEEATKSPLEPLDALDKLDREYAGAVDEMAECLRTYVRAHQATFEAALEAPAQRDDSPRSFEEFAERHGEEALAMLEGMAQRMKDEIATRHLLAEQRGMRPLDGSEDPRMTRFMSALGSLSVDQWLTICQRHVALPRKINAAQGEVASLSSDISVRLWDSKKFRKLVLDPALRVRDRTTPVLKSLPETVQAEGKEFPLQRVAVAATLGAWQALMLYDWLVVTEEGLRAARTLLAPFEGFAPLPE